MYFRKYIRGLEFKLLNLSPCPRCLLASPWELWKGRSRSLMAISFFRVGGPRLHGSQAALGYQARIGRLKCPTMLLSLLVTTLNQLKVGQGQASLDTLLERHRGSERPCACCE